MQDNEKNENNGNNKDKNYPREQRGKQLDGVLK